MAASISDSIDAQGSKPDFVNYAPGFANRFVHLPGWRGMVIGVGTAMAIAIVAGAFGTDRLDPLRRATFWIVTLGIFAVLWRAWFALTVSRSDHWSRAVWLGILPITLPLPLILHFALRLVGGNLREDWWRVWPSGIALAVAAAAGLVLLGFGVAQAQASKPQAKGRLFRHGVTDPARLLRASAEDHYVRLALDDGRSLLVHDRFSDLAAELHALDGAFPRRGQWVAARELGEFRRDGRKLLLVTLGGDEIAVSPAGRDELRLRGWIR